MPKSPPTPIYELTPEALEQIPARLRETPGFGEVWADWVGYRNEERNKRGRIVPLSPRAAKMQLRQLECEDNPVAFIERAIAANWEGLNIDIPLARTGYEPRKTGLIL